MLTLATYNFNGVNGRLPRLSEWLRERVPDVVCLQELKTDDSKFPDRAKEKRVTALSGTVNERITGWRSSPKARRR